MSDQIQVLDYPSFRDKHLEILPNLSLRIQYQDIPTVAPPLTSEDRAAFLDIMVKCFRPSVTNLETRFQISFLENDEAPTAIRQISPQFNWVKNTQYCLLGLLNFVPGLVSSASTTTRASSQDLRDLLNAVMNHDSNKAIIEIMKQANPDQPTWDSLAYFIHLTQVISKALLLNITKLHQGILLNYNTFQLEAGLTSLTASHSQMLLGLATKDAVMVEARRTYQIRENVITAYKDYLKLSNPNLQAFL